MKPSWLFKQSAVVPFVLNEEELMVALITSRKSKRWIIPKGVIECGLSPRESALKEADEEAGLVGISEGAPLGTYEYAKWGGICAVEVFAMIVSDVLDDWPERLVRQRRIVPASEALQLLERPELVEIVENGIARVTGSLCAPA